MSEPVWRDLIAVYSPVDESARLFDHLVESLPASEHFPGMRLLFGDPPMDVSVQAPRRPGESTCHDRRRTEFLQETQWLYQPTVVLVTPRLKETSETVQHAAATRVFELITQLVPDKVELVAEDDTIVRTRAETYVNL